MDNTKIKYVLYSRKSTESEERQILSIESQIKEMLQLAEKENLEIVDIRRESHSAKDSGKRPVFCEILEDIKRGRFNGILTWAPDRLSRNAGDLGSLVDLMDQKQLLQIRTYGQSFTNSPSEKFLLMILCSQAKLENDNKSVNVKRGLRTRCEMGLRPGPAVMGYLNEKRVDRKCEVIVDQERAPVIKKMFEKVAYEHWSGRKIYNWLKFELNFKTPKGNKGLTFSNIYGILGNPFYYGYFEYPTKSGNWYKGKHEPIISKELFDDVQKQMRNQTLVTRESKEFAFTKLIKCGLCDSGITAQEKFKKQQNGNTHRYVYYGCSKSKDRNCKSGYIEEKELIKQIENVLDYVELNENEVKNKINIFVTKVRDFNSFVYGEKTSIDIDKIDTKNYVKFVLKKGKEEEKRDIISSFKNGLILTNKTINIEFVK